MKPSKPLLLLSCVLGLTLLAGCGATVGGLRAEGRRVNLGERFKLEKDERVLVKDTNLAVQLKGVRRTWYVDGKGETADADIIITLDGREHRQWLKVGGKVAVGDYVVELAGADPSGKTGATLAASRN